MKQKNKKIDIPADVPPTLEEAYRQNYNALTRHTNHLLLFAADQKIEHLNNDFYGPTIPPEANNPEHLFKLASNASIGAFATHLGLIAQFGKQYPNINYIVKLNAKTNCIPTQQRDPISNTLWNVHEIIAFKKNSSLNICGIGFTIYLGSEFEHEMLAQAAHALYTAHSFGLITFLWIYPRGKSITNEHDPALLAGAAGIAASLGSDFVKINFPHDTTQKNNAEDLSIIAQAAGKTKVLCAGGPKITTELFLQNVYTQIQSGTAGSAVGRNLFQRPALEACALSNAMSAIIYEDKNVDQALTIYKKSCTTPKSSCA